MFDEKEIIKLLSNNQLDFLSLAKKMRIPKWKNQDFSSFLFSLVENEKIFINQKKEYFIPQFLNTHNGIIKINPRGFGFIDINDKSIFIAAKNTHSAMNNDEVEIKFFKNPSNENEFQGIVTKILNRAKKSFVGTIKKCQEKKCVIPFDQNIVGKFYLQNSNKVNINQEVKVEIIKYGLISWVKIIKILGYRGDDFMSIKVAIEDSNLPNKFMSQTIKESLAISRKISQLDIKDRKDLRKQLIVTIDGDDTKDFDDAISVNKDKNGNYVLGVHIADVAHYVKENSALDNEAQERGTSIYLVDHVIPMLPKTLSNDICSLNPNEDRLTISVEMIIDRNGKTIDYNVFPSIINSKYRLTYNELNKYYSKQFYWKDNKLHKLLDEALELSKIIKSYKKQQGYIDFEIEESKIIVNEKGIPINIVKKNRLESEIIIENFMVRANEIIAQFVQKNNLPFIYRVHEKPNMEKISNLQGVINALELKVQIPTNIDSKGFAKAINELKEIRFDDFMKIMMLRTMAKAIYSPTNIGHFGLAAKKYTHFTSPIRRYPDLMVHRMLREYFFNQNKKISNHFQKILPSIAKHCSTTEEKAMELERKVDDIKKAEFYNQYIGKTFKGTITSIMKFGFFVEFANKVNGLVHISTLMDKNFKLLPQKYSISNGEETFTIGSKVNVTIFKANFLQGKIELVIANKYKSYIEKMEIEKYNNYK